jgi:hypothetical protein
VLTSTDKTHNKRKHFRVSLLTLSLYLSLSLCLSLSPSLLELYSFPSTAPRELTQFVGLSNNVVLSSPQSKRRRRRTPKSGQSSRVGLREEEEAKRGWKELCV